ncbi:hypothetical protein DV515_00005865, partial [Chloebia gouldiae]
EFTRSFYVVAGALPWDSSNDGWMNRTHFRCPTLVISLTRQAAEQPEMGPTHAPREGSAGCTGTLCSREPDHGVVVWHSNKEGMGATEVPKLTVFIK